MANARKSKSKAPETGINRITVCGYKSISQERSIDIRPLTILAGANSSGKSSMIQPLLLFKQTLEASADPGTLLLEGPNLKFTAWDQLLSGRCNGTQTSMFRVGIGVQGGALTTAFEKGLRGGLIVSEMTYAGRTEVTTLRPGMTHNEIIAAVPGIRGVGESLAREEKVKTQWEVVPNRCFLGLQLVRQGKEARASFARPLSPSDYVEPYIATIIHLPGLRDNPERDYPVPAVGETYPGAFQHYVASVIAKWQDDGRQDQLDTLDSSLQRLGLTWKVMAKKVLDTRVELRVGRLPRRAKGVEEDMVSIADVGLGVSQVLPVVVALLVAEPGQMVYLEQPEIHLHPKAQCALADLIVKAAGRGVRVVAETHSDLLLLRFQTLVAQGCIPQDSVALHWFSRSRDGATKVTSGNLDEAGAFGNWPEDFGDVSLNAESEYLRAAETRLAERALGA